MNASKRRSIFFEPVISLKEGIEMDYRYANDEDFCFMNVDTGYYQFKGTPDSFGLERIEFDSDKRSLYRVSPEIFEKNCIKTPEGGYRARSKDESIIFYSGDFLDNMVKLALRIEEGIAIKMKNLKENRQMQLQNRAENEALLNSLIDEAY